MIGALKRLILRVAGWLLHFRLPSLMLVGLMRHWHHGLVRLVPSLRRSPSLAGLLALREGPRWKSQAPPASLDAWRVRLESEAGKGPLS